MKIKNKWTDRVFKPWVLMESGRYVENMYHDGISGGFGCRHHDLRWANPTRFRTKEDAEQMAKIFFGEFKVVNLKEKPCTTHANTVKQN